MCVTFAGNTPARLVSKVGIILIGGRENFPGLSNIQELDFLQKFRRA